MVMNGTWMTMTGVRIWIGSLDDWSGDCRGPKMTGTGPMTGLGVSGMVEC